MRPKPTPDRPRAKKLAPRKGAAVQVLRSVLESERERYQEEFKALDQEWKQSRAQLLTDTQELEASREVYADLYDFAPVGYATLDQVGCVREINLTAAALLGHRRESLLGQPLLPLLEKADQRNFLKYLVKFRAAPGINIGEFRFRGKDGANTVLQLIGECSSKARTGRPAIRVALFDATERKQAEEALRESEARFHTMADSAPVMIWVSDPNKSRTYFNGSWLEFRGRTLEQELGAGWTEGIHPADRQRCLDSWSTAIKARRELKMEYRLRRHDGVYRWMLDHGVPRVLSPNTFAGYIGSCIDITDHRQVEELLRQTAEQLEGRVRQRTAELTRTNAKLRAEIRAHQRAESARAQLAAIVESSSDAIVGFGLDLRITSWNKAASMLYGYTEQEMIGRSLSVFHPPERREEFRRMHQRVRRGAVVEVIEAVLLRKGGDRLDVSLMHSPIRDARGRVVGMAQIGRDITQRKQAEAALQASEAKFRGLVESAPYAVVIVDEHGFIRLVNSQTEQLFGYSRKELDGRSVELLMPERYGPHHRKHRRSYFTSARARSMGVGLELFGRHKDGREFPVEISLSPLRTEEGILVCSDIRDISGRKRAEQELRESQARLQAIMDNSPAMIVLKDWQGRYLHFNRRFALAFHLAVGKAIGKTDAQLFPPRQAETFAANDLKVIETGVPLQFEQAADHGDGPRISIVTKFPLRDEHGRIYAVGCIITDITEQRRLEGEVARVSERERRRIAGDLHDGLGQQLAGISCLSNALRQDLGARALPEAATAGRISNMLDAAVAQTRMLARGLYAVEAEPDGLMTALRELATRTSELFQVACRCECTPPVLVSDHATATHLYRIAQEAVANALKHGQASRIKIGLSTTPERLVLAVSNNGGDFKYTKRSSKGLGLRIMNDRAAQIGGRLIFEKNSRRENQVVCVVPNPGLAKPAH